MTNGRLARRCLRGRALRFAAAIALVLVRYSARTVAAEPSQASVRPCSNGLPVALAELVALRFAGSRVYDTLDFSEEAGRPPYHAPADRCPGSVSGDFDGDRKPDYALLLVDDRQETCQLVAALSRGRSRWAMDTLLPPHRCGASSVGTVAPGHHNSMLTGRDLTKELRRQGYVEEIDTRAQGIYLGAPETEGTAFFLKGRTWVRLEW